VAREIFTTEDTEEHRGKKGISDERISDLYF
jgi:hypothetical protein